MTPLDWTIVLGLNLFVFGYAALCARKTNTDVDWFLGGRNLPFWLVGVSMFATSVDGGEYVAINGATYQDGLIMITGTVFGVGIGGMVAAFLVVPRMYEAGVFTNAEYLELRFGPAIRIISVLVQIQYRTAAAATIAIALHLVLTEVAHLNTIYAWLLIVGLTLSATLYAAWGGLKTIAIADLLLGSVMISATLLLWFTIWNEVGGWSGTTASLTEQLGEAEASRLLHVGRQNTSDSPAVVIVLGWCLIATGYFVVNHTQTMKMFGVASLWDLKMSVVAGTGLIMFSGYFSSTMGVFGRVLLPDLERADRVFPQLVDQYLASGVKGLVVAGMVASAISTFEGIGAALSALFTRDIYARLIVKDAAERHYLLVSRTATFGCVLLSFAWVPFFLSAPTIVDGFVRVTSVFVTPLMTVYLVGVLTQVHRRSALIGLLMGTSYGMLAWQGAEWLPVWFTEKFTAYLWSTAITATGMLMGSWVLKEVPETVTRSTNDQGWLARSQRALSEMKSSPWEKEGVPWFARPEYWAVLTISAAAILLFGVFW